MSLDETDLRLIEELNKDARQPVRALARRIGMTRSAARYRMQRLIDNGILKIYCVSDEGHRGNHFPLLMGIKVTPGEAEVVAKQLAYLQEIKSVFLSAGRFNILAWAYLKDSFVLGDFMSEGLANIPDITDVEIMHCYQWVAKSQKHSIPKPATTLENTIYVPSTLDQSIIKAMQQDPRQTITRLAQTVGCSNTTAKVNLERLLDDGVIKLFTSIDQTVLGYKTGVAVLIKSKPDTIHLAANELLEQNMAMYVSLITGHWHIYFRTMFQDNGDLYDFLSNKLPLIAGVMEFEVLHMGKILKFTTSLGDSV